jgi:hypothetical protein
VTARAVRLAILATGGLLVVGLLAAPATGKLAVALVSLSVLAAMHGYGRILAAWARDPNAPVGLALAWGVAAYLGAAGVLIAVGLFGPAARTAIVVGGVVLHTGWLLQQADRVLTAARGLRPATVVAIAFSVLVLGLLVLAAAGRWSGPFSDGETSYLGQLRRLDDTGALADGFGFPRRAGLGGQIALSALATPLDARATYLVDRGLLIVILVLLAIAATGATLRAKAAVAAVLPLALTASAEYLVGPGPYGSLIVLVLATAISIDRAIEAQSARLLLLAVLLAAAAATITHAALVFALGIIGVGTFKASRWAHGGSWWRRRAAVVAVGVITPYLVSAIHARVVSPRPTVGHASAASIATGAAIGGVLAMLTVLALPGGRHRSALLAASASIAVAGAIATTPAAVLAYAGPVVVAIVLLLALLAIVREPAVVPLGATVVLVTLAVGLLAAARLAPRHPLLGWRTRAMQLVDDARAVGELPPASATRLAAAYTAAQDAVPAGARLAIWVERPDLIRYARNDVTDLRTRAARQLPKTLPHLPVDYLLVDASAPGDAWRAVPGETRYDAGGLRVVAVGGGAR